MAVAIVLSEQHRKNLICTRFDLQDQQARDIAEKVAAGGTSRRAG